LKGKIMTNSATKQRAALLAATPPEFRSEVAARFDAECEIERLQTAPPADYELERAVWDLNVAATADFIERCGYRSAQIYARLNGGVLPDHLREDLDRVQRQPHTEEDLAAAVRVRRAERIAYLRARYRLENETD